MNEEPDIDALHRAVVRERDEPTEGAEPVPRWMIAGMVALVGWGGWYLGRYDARFDARADMQPVASASAGADAAGSADATPALDGAPIYAGRCAACHQGNGQGMPGVAPPLDGSEWVTGDPERLLKVVVHGLSGPIEVKGEPWNGAMPPWGPAMTDEELAAVVSHVRSAWSNDAPPVTPDDVAEVRALDRSTPWTAQEL